MILRMMKTKRRKRKKTRRLDLVSDLDFDLYHLFVLIVLALQLSMLWRWTLKDLPNRKPRQIMEDLVWYGLPAVFLVSISMLYRS